LNGFVSCKDVLEEIPRCINKDVKAFALMAGVPAKQKGWMSKFGEQIKLPLEGKGEYTCPHTGERYILDGSVLRLEK